MTLFHAEERGYIVYGKVYVLRLTIGEGKDETSLDVTINQYAAVKRSEKERERIEKLMKINPLVLELLRIIRYCMKQWNLPGTQGGGSPSFFWRDWILEILETKLNKKRMKTLKDSDSDVFTTVLRYFFNTGLLSTERSDEKFNPFRSASECAPGVKLEYTVRFNWAWRELEMLQGNRSNDQTLERLCLDKPLVARWQHLAGNGSRKAPCGSGEGQLTANHYKSWREEFLLSESHAAARGSGRSRGRCGVGHHQAPRFGSQDGHGSCPSCGVHSRDSRDSRNRE